MVLMGIDPGQRTGAALYRDGALTALCTVTPIEVHTLIREVVPDMVVFEDSRLQSRVWTANKVRPAAGLKIARDVGRIDMLCELIQAECERLRITCHGVSPKGKGAKVNAEAFERITGWATASNEHTRDAAMVAYPYRRAHAVQG